MKNKAFDIINVKFSYNGVLGTLQAMTVNNKGVAERLLLQGIITGEEYKEVALAIEDYFKTEIEEVLKQPYCYSSFI